MDSQRPVTDFTVDLDNLRGSFDTMHMGLTGNGKVSCNGYSVDQYLHGLDVGREYEEVHISVTDSWSASKPQSSLQAYERIGYHACTFDLMMGFLNSGARIFVHRLVDGKVETTEITGTRWYSTSVL